MLLENPDRWVNKHKYNSTSQKTAPEYQIQEGQIKGWRLTVFGNQFKGFVFFDFNNVYSP